MHVDVLEQILGENDRIADHNRSDFDDAGVHLVNLMSSPGAGKTTLLCETVMRPGRSLRVGVVEGDIETSIDADRLSGLGAPVSFVNTANGFGGECHLDAVMVRSALARLSRRPRPARRRECRQSGVPSRVRCRRDARAMVFSVTEGEDKPLKYPVMFRATDIVVVNKIDLLPHLDFDLDRFYANLRDVHPEVRDHRNVGQDWCGCRRVVRLGHRHRPNPSDDRLIGRAAREHTQTTPMRPAPGTSCGGTWRSVVTRSGCRGARWRRCRLAPRRRRRPGAAAQPGSRRRTPAGCPRAQCQGERVRAQSRVSMSGTRKLST